MTSFRPSTTDPTPNDSTSTGSTILLEALGNTDPGTRLAITNQLLDDGADASATQPSGVNALHILFGARNHDFSREAVLVQRLIDGGADINGSALKFGTPLQTLARNFAYSDDDYAPLYDVMFSRSDLDLTSPQASGRTVLEAFQVMAAHRPQLVERAERHLGPQT